MHIPWRNCMIRLLLQYLDEEASAPPFLRCADTNLPFPLALFVWVSQSASTGPARGPNQPLSLSLLFSFSCSFSLTLRSSSSSPLLIALLIFHWQESMRREGGEREKKTHQHKLSKSHWPTSADISLGIHISAKELGEEMPPPPFLPIFLTTPSFFSFSWKPFSSHPIFDPVWALQYIIQVDKRLTVA